MAPIYIFFVLIIQSSLSYANDESEEIEVTSSEILIKPDFSDEIEEFHDSLNINDDWGDMFLFSSTNLYPTSSTAMMAQATSSNKTAEEQLEEIKEIAEQITNAIQNEMTYLLSYALSVADKDTEDNLVRKRRSAETPMDSTQMVMRLLKHIKSNNEYQNIAIEKMMSAQEIAEKFNIEFTPDPEILSDLALSANQQTQDLTTILQEAFDLKNSTKDTVEFVPLEDELELQNTLENNTYYVYSVAPEQDIFQNTLTSSEYIPQETSEQPLNQAQQSEYYPHYNSYYNYPFETQILPPAMPSSPRPNFYDSFIPEFYPYCPAEPVTTTTTIVMPYEEPAKAEAELMGEEIEETVTSRTIIERGDEPGSTTVNHVMTYTVTEKSHYKTPQIEKMPQQMQYCFFLI